MDFWQEMDLSDFGTAAGNTPRRDDRMVLSRGLAVEVMRKSHYYVRKENDNGHVYWSREEIASNLAIRDKRANFDFIDWHVAESHFGRCVPPYPAFWPLSRGRHRISAVTPGHVGTSLEITVE